MRIYGLTTMEKLMLIGYVVGVILSFGSGVLLAPLFYPSAMPLKPLFTIRIEGYGEGPYPPAPAKIDPSQ